MASWFDIIVSLIKQSESHSSNRKFDVAPGRVGVCKVNMLQAQMALTRVGMLGYKVVYEHTFNILKFYENWYR